MKLLYTRASPFVRKVTVLLQESSRAAEVELVDVAGSATAPNPTLIATNPIGKIPCLVDDDGNAVYDSRVITRFLDAQLGTGLYPQDDRIWPTLRLEGHADGMLDAGVLCVYEVRYREEAIRSADWVAAQHGRIIRGLDVLEASWLEHLNGPLDMGQIAIGCMLSYLDFRRDMGGWPEWREGRPGLSAWGDAFLQRPSILATAPT